MPGAALTLTQAETQQQRSTLSNDTGAYAFLSLPVGLYTLDATKEGFAPFKQTGIQVTVGQAAELPVTLQIGDVNQAVTVSGEISLVHTSEGAISRLVNEHEVEGLPLNGRNPADLVFLAPAFRIPCRTFRSRTPEARFCKTAWSIPPK